MELQYPPVIIIYLLATVVSCYGGYRSWRMRPAKGAFPWSMAMFSTGWWSFLSVINSMMTTQDANVVTIQLMYIGIIGAIYSWGYFTLTYSQYEKWVTRRNLMLLAVVPVTFYLLILSNGWHEFVFTSPTLSMENGYVVFTRDFGTGFWLWAVFAYTVVLGGAGLLIFSIVRYPDLYRGQAALLVTGVLVPLFFNVLYLSGASPLGSYDPSAIGYTLTGILILMGMNRYGFLNVVPVAHDLIFKSVHSGVIIIDDQGFIMDINPAAARILNTDAQGIIGQSLVKAFPEHRELIMKFRGVLETKTEIIANGRHYELQIMPLTNRAGKSAGRIIMLYDITEQKQALKELDAYAHTVAHDLKTPLGVVIGYADFIEQFHLDKVDDALRQRLIAIGTSGRKMQFIIDELLLLSSVRDQQHVETAPVNMGEVVEGALARLSRVIDDAGAEIIKPEHWHSAMGHAPWVEEIWANYLSNAIKYGGTPPVIEVGSTPLPNGQIRFWVRDNGVGLNTMDRQRLFSEFTRLDQHSKLEGHGLGLSIVQRIATRLEGMVGVEDYPQGGSLFYFTLPTVQAAEVA